MVNYYLRSFLTIVIIFSVLCIFIYVIFFGLLGGGPELFKNSISSDANMPAFFGVTVLFIAVIMCMIFMVWLFKRKVKQHYEWARHYSRTDQHYKSLNYPYPNIKIRTKKGKKTIFIPRGQEDMSYLGFPGPFFWRYMRKIR